MSESCKLYWKNCNKSLLKYFLLCPKDLRLNCGERGVGGKKATDFLLEDDFFTLFMMVSPFFCRSATFNQRTGDCRISDMDRHTVSGTEAFTQSRDGDQVCSLPWEIWCKICPFLVDTFSVIGRILFLCFSPIILWKKGLIVSIPLWVSIWRTTAWTTRLNFATFSCWKTGSWKQSTPCIR